MGAPPRHHQTAHAARARRTLEQAAPAGPEVERIELTIPGPAHGHQRPRFGNGRTYTPQANRDHARRVAAAWQAEGAPRLPRDCWYVLWVESSRARPDSHYLKDGSLSAAGRRAPFPGKPDADNEWKGIADALVACGAIPDDARCVDMCLIKRWVPNRGDEEHTKVVAAEMPLPGGEA